MSSTSLALIQENAEIGERYWNLNVPPEHWTEECPDFLLGEESKNVCILSTRDEDFRGMSWPEVKKIVGQFS